MINIIRHRTAALLLCFIGLPGGAAITQTLSAPPAVYSHIPVWVCQPFPDMPDSVRVLGISDPGLPPGIARQQAFLRGISFASLASGSKGSFLSDLFSREAEQEKNSCYEEIFRFHASVCIDPNHVRILEETTLNSGEVILLMDFPLVNDSSPYGEKLTTELVLYLHEVNASQSNKLMRKYLFSLNLNANGSSFTVDDFSFFRLNRKASGIRTPVKRSQACYDSLEFYYGITSATDAGDTLPERKPDSVAPAAHQEEYQPSTCSSGLWIAFFSQVLEQASLFIRQMSVKTTRLSDSMTGYSMDLSREGEVVTMDWRINQFILRNQEATAHIRFHSLNTP